MKKKCKAKHVTCGSGSDQTRPGIGKRYNAFIDMSASGVTYTKDNVTSVNPFSARHYCIVAKIAWPSPITTAMARSLSVPRASTPTHALDGYVDQVQCPASGVRVVSA